MKHLLLALSVLLSTSLSAVEYRTYSIGKSQFSEIITLDEGDMIEVIGTGTHTARFGFHSYESNIQQENIHFENDNFAPLGFANAVAGHKFSGPIKLTIYGYNIGNNDKVILSVKITEAAELEYKNVNIISLPSSSVGQGTHEIVVEASDDLQSWTPVHSSSIGGDKAFFRTRVVEAE